MKIMLSMNSNVLKYLGMAIENPRVPFTYNDTTFVNLKELYDFVERCSKDGFLFEEVLKEVIEKVQDGHKWYELGSFETKSGHAESISFAAECDYDEEEDTAKYTITF